MMKKMLEKIPGYNKLVLPLHRLRAFRAANKHDYPAASMKVIGVTGTNGKTTTAFMIHSMLTEAGYKTGLMTTVAYGVGKNLKSQISHMTTVSAGLLNQRIADMRDAGAEYLVLEVTSHALAQCRTFGIPFDTVVMTNITHEHLDYHKTFANYLGAKLKLFKLAHKTHDSKKIGIVNYADPSAKYFASAIDRSLAYGIEQGDIVARQVKLTASGVEYYVKLPRALKDEFPEINEQNFSDKLHIRTHIPGEFNVYNSLAAVTVGLVYGLTVQQIEDGIAALTSVEGRMTRLDEGQKFQVVVDFAHTPDSFEKLLKDFRATTNGQLIVMFGSAGRRDEAKRAIQGEIAGKYADIVVLTEEDDRDVDGEEILTQIASGAEQSGKKLDYDLFKILDRTKAIEFTLQQAKSADDVVMLLGKGHEKTIERTDGEHPWHEIETTRKFLKKLTK
ncbi:UDP-N-acetylmuramoyl-L-alanyl-D-glutamate--2,6-diaminopimelate ligase [Candidatus Saccharibacteria bacterium]|nr:UDP-N-acetylmuramoyl-L-alanyl-D-glutamate--2,6-diaminopimelate ligase [Candidatus Saccharibacteria bacterium]